jgi:hypothetical protein
MSNSQIFIQKTTGVMPWGLQFNYLMAKEASVT